MESLKVSLPYDEEHYHDALEDWQSKIAWPLESPPPRETIHRLLKDNPLRIPVSALHHNGGESFETREEFLYYARESAWDTSGKYVRGIIRRPFRV
jgi:hypothetical protein